MSDFSKFGTNSQHLVDNFKRQYAKSTGLERTLVDAYMECFVFENHNFPIENMNIVITIVRKDQLFGGDEGEMLTIMPVWKESYLFTDDGYLQASSEIDELTTDQSAMRQFTIDLEKILTEYEPTRNKMNVKIRATNSFTRLKTKIIIPTPIAFSVEREIGQTFDTNEVVVAALPLYKLL